MPVQYCEVEQEIKRALENNEFTLYYQSIIDIKTRALVGCESLVRWKHPSRGMLMPGEFLGAVENAGLMAALGDAIFRKACLQAKRWFLSGYMKFTVAVNFSSAQFKDPDLIGRIKRILDETSTDPQRIVIEISEQIATQESQSDCSTLKNISGMGLKICIDDFSGDGASLICFRKFPISSIKIGRSIVKTLPSSNSACSTATAIIGMAHGFGTKVTAVGVENSAQLGFLHKNGCDFIQGYLIDKPQKTRVFTSMLKD